MNEQTQKKQSSTGGELLLVVVLILIAASVFIFCPGMVLVAFFKTCFSCSWDVSQTWTFGIAISVAVWFGFYIRAHDFRKSLKRYLALCAFTLGVFAFSHFGLKTKFTEDAIHCYFPPSQAPPQNTSPIVH